MKRTNVLLVLIAGLSLFVAQQRAAADDDCPAKIPPKKKVHVVHKAAPLTDDQKLARDYQARRAAGDNRNCPCAANAGNYCSCASSPGYGPDSGYGYGYGIGSNPYGANAGWSRGWGHASDIPTAGYTGVYHR